MNQSKAISNEEITSFGAVQLNTLFKSGKLSAIQIATAFIERIKTLEPSLNAFITLSEESFFKKAHELDFRKSQGEELGSFAAVPVGVKDNICVSGEKLTCASKFLENYVAPYESTVTQRLLDEDAMLIGKLNMDEFGMGSNMKNSAYGISRNPWNLDRTPGGSSGGSSSAVAARLCPIALGTDTGGSIRQPASFCGIYGFKPSYGSVSRWGVVAFGSSLDQIGPLAHRIEDIGLCMQVISGSCTKDSTCIDRPAQQYLRAQDQTSTTSEEPPLANMRIGVPHHFLERLNPDTKEVFYRHLELFEQQGAQVIDVPLDILKHSIAVYYIIACAEASTNLSRFDGVRYGKRSPKAENLQELYKFSKEEGFGYEVKKRILLGNYCLASEHQDAFFKKAQKVRKMIHQHYLNAFEECDFIITPTTPSGAYEFDAQMDPLQVYLADIYTSPINLAGLPSISIPAGFDKENMPLGLQITAAPFKDKELFQAALAIDPLCEKSTPPLNKLVKQAKIKK